MTEISRKEEVDKELQRMLDDGIILDEENVRKAHSRIDSRRHRRNNREKSNKYQKEYRRKHSKKRSDYQKEYREKHRQELIEYKRKYNIENKDLMIERENEKFKLIAEEFNKKGLKND